LRLRLLLARGLVLAWLIGRRRRSILSSRSKGKPAERGRRYGARVKGAIARFLEREIYSAFVGKPATKDELLRYADGCAKAIAKYSPVVFAEMEGMAEGSGLTLADFVLLSLHEELYHKGAIPSVEHCHVAAAGPPTTTGDTFVGQTWDWMESVFGLSQMLLWKRDEGPDVLAYGYPGMWIGAALK
jgi:isopenicillin-N N-acyltransferase-like protein